MAIEHQVARKSVLPCKPRLVELSELITEEKAAADGVPYLCVFDGSAELQPSNENGPARGFDWSLSIDDLARRSGNVGIRVRISLGPFTEHRWTVRGSNSRHRRWFAPIGATADPKGTT